MVKRPNSIFKKSRPTQRSNKSEKIFIIKMREKVVLKFNFKLNLIKEILFIH